MHARLRRRHAGLRRSGVERLALLSALALLVACNALNGTGDLTVGPCEGCDAVEGGAGADGNIDGNPIELRDAMLDGPGAADTSKEGPGGILDTTFGTGGIIVMDPLVDPRAVAVRADGRIVVVGSSSNNLAAAAFTSTGAVDTTFGTAGRIVEGSGSSSVGNALAFDSKGRAFIGGSAVVVTTVSTRFAYAVRVSESAVDTTFGMSGSLRGTIGGQDVRGVVVTAGDGAVLSIADGDDHRFLRLGESGIPDSSFGSSGAGTVPNVGGEPAGLVALTDGFVSGGTGTFTGTAGGLALAAAKVSPVGQPVVGFGTLARATSKVGPSNSQAGRSIATQADGKLLVAGDYDPNVNLLRRVTAVTRFAGSGQLDTGYGTAGKVDLDLSEPLVGRETETTNVAVAVDPNGRALVVGGVYDKLLAGGDRNRAWVVRLKADGSFDPLFGTLGKLLVGTAPAQLEVRGAALQADGKLVIVGVDMNGNRLFLARIITSTTL